MLDARELPFGSVLTADVCVIGGGAAGITIARALAGGPSSVLLLESGGREIDEATQALAAGEVVGEPLLAHGLRAVDLVDTRLRYLGGSTNHWAGACAPLYPADLASPPGSDVSGWPIAYDELARWYPDAAALCQVGDPRFDWRLWADEPDLGPPLVVSERLDGQLFLVRFPVPFGELYGDEVAAADGVEVCLWANVTELRTGGDGQRVTEAVVRTLDGNELTAVADRYVLAVGGIDNARLLLASTDANPEGLGNDGDQVGRWFNEHLRVPAGVAVLDPEVGDLALHGGRPVARAADGAEVTVRAALELTPEVRAAEDLLGVQLQPVPAEPDDRPVFADSLTAADVAVLVDAAGGETGGEIGDAPVVLVQVTGEQLPNPESRVRLGDTVDALGMPTVVLDWRTTEVDRRSIVRALEILGEDLGAAGVGRLQAVPGGMAVDEEAPPGGLLANFVVDPAAVGDAFPLGIGFHHMGTTRMADDPAEGVVDADCRVHGVENLYVAGSSVFPTSGTAPPTLTIVALALRLADHLESGPSESGP
ncbi:MAG: GMC family oxidoreductase [Acidimicrobiia bacterium]|nr:GMC family oxidoreductase [Acidimicrobiia bacterium]